VRGGHVTLAWTLSRHEVSLSIPPHRQISQLSSNRLTLSYISSTKSLLVAQICYVRVGVMGGMALHVLMVL